MSVPWPVRLIPSIAYQAWFTPPPLSAGTARRDAEAAVGLDRVTVPVDGGALRGLSLGTGPLVLAVHGWGGRAAQMAPLAHRLAPQGYRVLALDWPGHAGGPATDIKIGAAAMRAVVDEVGQPAAVVAHSIGCLVVRLAFPLGPPPAIVMVAPLIQPSRAVDVFADRLQLAPWVRSALKRRLHRWDPQVWEEINRIDPAQLPGADLLMIHDPEDIDTPFPITAELAASRPGTEMVAGPGLGHAGALADPEMLDLMVSFIGQRVSAPR